ncbi:hypothetical protein NMY22_g11837 [Coprinellus aureogranulatus]|nr:hypothetical protein NMY22_g11837 [Coprinellus aureogranulatus]
MRGKNDTIHVIVAYSIVEAEFGRCDSETFRVGPRLLLSTMTVTLDLAEAVSNVHTRRALNELSAAVVKKKKIVVVTGAGISCSCGIPDFRSSDGLYNMVKERYPDVVMKGRDLFDASLFRDTTSTSVFYSFIAELKKKIDEASPSPTHNFIKTLDSKNKLLRSYTQNIDGLEERVGLVGSSGDAAKASGKGKNAGKLRVKEVRNVQLHGDIHRVRCVMCSAEFPCAEEHLSAFLEGTAPDCPECLSRSEARVARSARAIRVGSLRPAIVLYDEPHPLGEDIGTIQMADVNKKPDLLIIMGTSMKHLHLLTYNEDIPVELLAQRLCDLKQGYTQYGGLRPFGVSLLYAGYDAHYGFQLYHSDPSGNYSGWKATCIGANSGTAQSLLKQEYKDGLGVKEAVGLVLRTMSKTMDSTSLGSEKLEFAVLTLDPETKQPKAKIYRPHEIDALLLSEGLTKKEEEDVEMKRS